MICDGCVHFALLLSHLLERSWAHRCTHSHLAASARSKRAVLLPWPVNTQRLMLRSQSQTSAEQPGHKHFHLKELNRPTVTGRSTDSAERAVPGFSLTIAAQLAVQSNSESNSSSIDDSSAAPPAPQLDGPQACSDWQVLRECSDWLQTLPPQEISQSKPLQRLQTAVALLQSRSSRQQRQNVQQLFGRWGVPQKTQGCKRKYDGVKTDFVAKLVGETHRLKRMQDVAKAARPDTSASSTGGRFSAIQAAFRRGSVQTST